MYNWNREILQGIERIDANGMTLKGYAGSPKSLIDVFNHSVERFPEKIALVDEHHRLSYRTVNRLTSMLAKEIRSKGIKKGDRVALLMKNTVGFCLSVIAVLKLGGIVVPLNTKLKPSELEILLQKAKPELIIADNELISNIQEGLPILKESDIPLIENDSDGLDECVAQPNEWEPAFILFTSGTTGHPKGAVLSHANAIHAAINYERCYGLSHEDTTIIAVPIFHGTGLFAQFTAFLYLGGTIVLLKTFNSTEMLELCEKHQVTHTIVVPTIYTMLLNTPNYQSYQLSLRVLGSGGAPLPKILDEKIREWIPNVKLINTYGLTEATSPAIIMPYEMAVEKMGSVGIPSPITECRIVDPNTGQEMEANQPGELLLKGPIIIQKYWDNEEATSKAIQNGWLRTGDIATMDKDGFIYIKDRVKDMINRGGEKIYSTEVEDILYRHPLVLEAAVVGVPDSIYGEVPKAYIVLKEGESLTEGEIKDWALHSLAKYKVPHYVKFIDTLPRNAGGKVLKKQLLNDNH